MHTEVVLGCGGQIVVLVLETVRRGARLVVHLVTELSRTLQQLQGVVELLEGLWVETGLREGQLRKKGLLSLLRVPHVVEHLVVHVVK